MANTDRDCNSHENSADFHLETGDRVTLFGQCWSPTIASDNTNALAVSSLAPVIGLIHGLGEHSGRYDSVASYFASRGFAVLSYHQRGHGKTGGKLPCFETLLNDIAQFESHICSRFSGPLVLYGQSLGGLLTLHYAMRFETQAVAFISSSPLLTPAQKPPRWKIAFAKSLRRIWPTLELKNGIDPKDLSRRPEVASAYLSDPLNHDRLSVQLGLSMLEAGQWALQHAHELSKPTLIMHGTADRITSCESTKQFAARSSEWVTLRCWESHRHELHFEIDREAVLEYVTAWIESQIGSVSIG